jgi:hypothetical protein
LAHEPADALGDVADRLDESADRTAPVRLNANSDLRNQLEAAPGIEPGYRDLQSLA